MKRLCPFFALLVFFALMLTGCGGVDAKYAYNTAVITNPDAPVAGLPNLDTLDCFEEKALEGFETPMTLNTTLNNATIEILNVGVYHGPYIEDGSFDEVSACPAFIVRNNGEKIISYASVAMSSGSKSFALDITNLRPGCCALVLASDNTMTFDDLDGLKVGDIMQINSSQLIIPEENTIGVSYVDGSFVITNCTGENLGTVYIRYKYITSSNVYLGGVTRSVYQDDVLPYKTYLVPDDGFSDVNCEIVAVENIKPE